MALLYIRVNLNLMEFMNLSLHVNIVENSNQLHNRLPTLKLYFIWLYWLNIYYVEHEIICWAGRGGGTKFHFYIFLAYCLPWFQSKPHSEPWKVLCGAHMYTSLLCKDIINVDCRINIIHIYFSKCGSLEIVGVPNIWNKIVVGGWWTAPTYSHSQFL